MHFLTFHFAHQPLRISNLKMAPPGRASAANKHAHPDHPHNYTMMQAFEWYTPGGGTHYRWLKDNAARFADIGITAVWMPPPTKGASQESTGYDVYDLYDLGEFKREGHESERTKYGTRKELEECYKALKDNKIAIYVDAVLNHKGGADDKELFKAQMVDQNKRTEDIGEPYDIEGWTKFDFKQRNGKYSDFKWNATHFTGVDYDAKGEQNGIWRIVGDGKYWSKEVDKENANYDFLMCADIDHAHPDVRKDLFNWGSWMVNNFPISGFRFDAVKHISRSFICDFVHHVREAARQLRKDQGKEPLDEEGGPIMFGVGEFWKDSVDSCMKYLGEFGEEQFSLFDAPLHYNFKEAGDGGKNYDIRKIFDGTIVQSRPLDAVTLCSNHDTQKGQALESPVPASFLPQAHALILLRVDGYPCIFLGDLDGTHQDGDKPAEEPVSNLASFIRARKLFAYGEQVDYWDNANCVGWVRKGDVPSESEAPGAGHDGCAVVICNGDQEGTKWMEVGKDKKGRKYVDVLGWTQGEVEINEDGWGEFRCPATSVGIWVLEDAKGREEFK